MARYGKYEITVMAFPKDKRFLLQISKPKYAMLGINVTSRSYTVQHYEGNYDPAKLPRDLIKHIEGYVKSFRETYPKCYPHRKKIA